MAPFGVADEVARPALEALLVVEEDPAVGRRHEEVGRAGDDAGLRGAAAAGVAVHGDVGPLVHAKSVVAIRSSKLMLRPGLAGALIRTPPARPAVAHQVAPAGARPACRSSRTMRRRPGFGSGLSTRNIRSTTLAAMRPGSGRCTRSDSTRCGRSAQLAMILEHEGPRARAAGSGPAGRRRPTCRPPHGPIDRPAPATMPEPIAKFTPSSQMPAARQNAAASPATSRPGAPSVGHHVEARPRGSGAPSTPSARRPRRAVRWPGGPSARR